MSKWNEGYAAGHKAAWERRDATDHLIYYGAIRRALGVARDLERGGWHKMEADAIRWAIRAALKQETP